MVDGAIVACPSRNGDDCYQGMYDDLKKMETKTQKLKAVHFLSTDTMDVYLPVEDRATGRAVVACPGGSYNHLNMPPAESWVRFFTNRGIAAVILKYHLPDGSGEEAMNDVIDAFATLRAKAEEWRINPEDIGIAGYSAGGHLASLMATRYQKAIRASFQILFYPVTTMFEDFGDTNCRNNFLGEDKMSEQIEAKYSAIKQITSDTPRAFIVVCSDDDIVKPFNSANYYVKLQEQGIPSQLIVYPLGKHGWGIGVGDFPYTDDLKQQLTEWLKGF